MPQKVTIDGTEQEVYTAAELAEQSDAKAKQASEAAVAAEAERLKEEHAAALLEKEEALAEAREKLSKAEAKELNFKALREKGEKGTKEVSEEAKKVAEEVKAMKETLAEIQKQPFSAAEAAFRKNNIGTDKELEGKFDLFFNKLKAGSKTVEEYNTALESAMTLATGNPYQASSNSSITRTSVDPGFGGEHGKVESQDSQAFGKLLGVTQEDKKTYGSVLATGVVPMFTQARPKEKNV